MIDEKKYTIDRGKLWQGGKPVRVQVGRHFFTLRYIKTLEKNDYGALMKEMRKYKLVFITDEHTTMRENEE